MDIGPGRIISDFIEPNRKQYVIPVYQRNYEWSEDDCIKLFDDILNAYRRGTLHFCGSVVYAPLEIGLDLQSFVIIDGQQRLTTIYLLIKALLDSAEGYDKDFFTETIMNVRKQDPFDLTESTKLKLKPVKSDNNQLLLLMDNRFEDVDKSSGIWRNYELFTNLIKKALEGDEGLRLKDIYNGIDRLTCAKILLGPDDNAQEIFERINSTGVPLSLADKIRNYVLMTDIDQDRLYESYWLNIERLIKKDYRNDFFYAYLNLKLDEFAKEKIAYEQFKELYSEGGYTNESMLKEVLHYAELYNSFMYGSESYSAEINRYLGDLQSLNQTTVFLFLFRIFDDYLREEKVLAEDELERILKLLVSYSVRRTICEVNSNSLRGLYKTLYSRVFSNGKNKEYYYDSIASFLLQLTSKDEIPGDAEFKEALKYNNLYKKNALCRFLLTSIENQGKEKLITDNLTIEHIMPQNKDLSVDWREMLGSDWENVRNKYLNTLGNLTLTGYNSELGDRPFMEKQEMLNEYKTKVVVLYQGVKGLTEWNEKQIEARAEKLSNAIVNMFEYDEPSHKIAFYDPKYKEYSCNDPKAATFKSPNYFMLNGERIKVSSFAELLRKIIDRLYEIDKTIIEQMARNDERLLEWSEGIMFSYDYRKTSGGTYKVADSEIYESVGFSAAHIMYIVAALLDRYDIDYEDFSYSARDTVNKEGIVRSEVAKKWCESQKAKGEILFDPASSNRYYVRFTTPYLNTVFPECVEKLSPWRTKNYYFYEIRNYKGKMFIQLAVYCKTAEKELRKAIEHFAKILQVKELPQGYKVFLETKEIENKEDDTEEIVLKQLDELFSEVKNFELEVKNKIEG